MILLYAQKFILSILLKKFTILRPDKRVCVVISRLTISGCLTIGRQECWVKSRGGAIKTMKKALQDGWNTPKMQRLFL